MYSIEPGTLFLVIIGEEIHSDVFVPGTAGLLEVIGRLWGGVRAADDLVV